MNDLSRAETPRLFGMINSVLYVAAAALLVCVMGWFVDRTHFYRAYLFAWLVCVGIALGSMSIIMLHHLTGGAWGWPVRRPAEAAAMTLPLLTILFLPIAFGAAHIFPWADAGMVAGHAVLRHRQPVFNVPFTLARAFCCLVLWSFWAWRLQRLSIAYDESGDVALPRRLRAFSAVGLVMYFITMSSCAVDWIASREFDWYSSTFGLATIVGQSAAGVSFLIVVLALLSDVRPLKAIAGPDVVHDLGNLLLVVTVLWAYVTFAQYLVIWSGNTQEDNLWYYHRTRGGWQWVGTALIVLHFGVPFFLLLIQHAKRNLNILACIAGGVLFMRVVDVLWNVAPSSPDPEPHGVSWLDFIAPLGVGGVWFASFIRRLNMNPLVPARYGDEINPLNESHAEDDRKTSGPVA